MSATVPGADPATIIGDGDRAVGNDDLDNRSNAGFFAGVSRGVDEFLQNATRGQSSTHVPGLVGEFFSRAELGQPRRSLKIKRSRECAVTAPPFC